MLRSMFARLMAMAAAVILLSVALLFGVFAYTSREAQVAARLEALKVQAYDIAMLTGTTSGYLPGSLSLFGESPSRALLLQKIRSVYEEYDAYSIVVDRSGRATGYFSSIIEEDAELRSSFDARDIVATIARVLRGEEVAMATSGAGGPMFTVAVPWVSGGAVLGAVYIQTAAQSVRASYAGLWRQAALAAAAAFLLAAALAFFFARRLTRPLERIAQTAAEMAGLPSGETEGGGVRELEALSASITGMGAKIAATERVRRDFIANLSHELRSPMTSIQGFVRGMLDGTVPEEDREKTLGIVLEETQRMNRLVSGLLDLSRAEASQSDEAMAPFDICELARRAAIVKIGKIDEKLLNLHTDFGREEIYALGIRDQIEQVFINLLDNAIRFTPEGGNIWIEIRESGELIETTVRDDGIGVSPEDAERVFERFYTGSPAHTAGEGAGLGLAISKTIIEKHGQGIRLVRGEVGAAFRFTLRKVERPAGKARADGKPTVDG